MELLQLRYFYESAESENFSRTAEKYMVPVTSVSASVRRLEKELNCKLFDRDSNRLRLNSNGKRLQKSLHTIFSELDDVVEELTAPETDTRVIKMLVRAMRSSITDHIIEYNKKHPHIEFQAVFDYGDTDYEKYDIVIDEKKELYPKYDRFELYNIRLHLLVASSSPLAEKKFTMKQLHNEPFVSLNTQSNMQRILGRSCERAGFTPNIIAEMNDIACHNKMIESGLGIGIGRNPSRTNHSQSIRALDVVDFNERYIVCTYYKKQSSYGNVQHFLNFLQKQGYAD